MNECMVFFNGEKGGRGRRRGEEARGGGVLANSITATTAQPLSRCERAEANILSSIAALAAVLNSLVSMMLACDAASVQQTRSVGG